MIRITAGVFRGRSLLTPSSAKTTRPTQAKLRQALFNSVQGWLPDANVLDLFSGSGALGFEALSRGATRVVFVEKDRTAVQLIQKNAATLGVQTQITVLGEGLLAVPEASPVLRRVLQKAPFDLILADPPYSEGWEEKLLNGLSWGALLSPEGIFCLEWGKIKSQVRELPSETPWLVKVREKEYGDSVLTTYQLKSVRSVKSEQLVVESPSLNEEDSAENA